MSSMSARAVPVLFASPETKFFRDPTERTHGLCLVLHNHFAKRQTSFSIQKVIYLISILSTAGGSLAFTHLMLA